MSDHLIRGITADGWLRVSAVESTGICERMRNIHKTLPLATAALGRTLTAASMMGEQLKDEQFRSVYLQQTETMFTEVALNTGGVEGFFLRIDPAYGGNTAGFYKLVRSTAA